MYLVGDEGSSARAIALDSAGNIFVTDGTESNNFPLKNPLQKARAGTANAFISKLDSTGKQLLYSTYFGGDSRDTGFGIAVGSTQSPKFPTKNPLYALTNGGTSGFV